MAQPIKPKTTLSIFRHNKNTQEEKTKKILIFNEVGKLGPSVNL